MSQQSKTTGSSDLLLALGAGSLWPLAALLVFLTANDYSVVAAEVMVIYLVPLTLGLALAALVAIRRPQLARIGLWAYVSGSIIMMLGDASVLRFLLVAIAVGLVIRLLRDTATPILLIAAIVHGASTLAFSGSPSDGHAQYTSANSAAGTMSESDLAPVLHIVLDEMIGPHGIPPNDPAAGSVHERISSIFAARGFTVYDRAYAEYVGTSDSLSNLFNFDASPIQQQYFSRPVARPVLTANRYFDHLRDLGYAIHVHQSTHLDFCGYRDAAVASCSTYRSNSIHSVEDAAMPTIEKARLVLNSFLESARAWRGLRLAYNRSVDALGLEWPVWALSNSHTGPLTSVPVANQLGKQVANIEAGEVYFAHLMLAHYPYALDADCVIKPRLDTWLYRAPRAVLRTLEPQNNAASRQRRYQHYLQQYQCTLSLVDEILQQAASGEEWDRAIVIIHGDHGSRIVRQFPLGDGNATPDDYRDVYSTFFAARNGAATSQASDSPLPLSAILADIWEIAPPDSDQHRVFAAELGAADLVAIPLRGFDREQ